MTASKGGVVILAIGLFGLGWLAAPEARTVVKKDVVTIRVPDTHVVEKKVTETTPLPQSCASIPDLAKKYRDISLQYSDLVTGSPAVLSEARKAIVDKDLLATTKSLEELGNIQEAITAIEADLSASQSRWQLAIKQCEDDTK